MAWNSLPLDIRTALTPSTFMNLLKTHPEHVSGSGAENGVERAQKPDEPEHVSGGVRPS